MPVSGQTLDILMGHLGTLGLLALDGWDAVATSLVERDKVATYGATDERVNPLDQAQYDAMKGPCVDAIQTGEVQYFNGDDVPPRWRPFAEAAADHDVYSVVSFPLNMKGEVFGAINFYSRERDALRPGQKEEGWIFATQASVILANVKEFEARGTQLKQLEEGLKTRTMIGQATGLLMAQEALTSDEAFQKLVKVSQTANVKLRDIAQNYVEAWESKLKSGGSQSDRP
ncbi:MAG: ANTAR domain-containing protein [Actinomycetota bacterium]